MRQMVYILIICIGVLLLFGCQVNKEEISNNKVLEQHSNDSKINESQTEAPNTVSTESNISREEQIVNYFDNKSCFIDFNTSAGDINLELALDGKKYSFYTNAKSLGVNIEKPFDSVNIPLYIKEQYPLNENYSIEMMSYKTVWFKGTWSSDVYIRLFNFTSPQCQDFRKDFKYLLGLSCSPSKDYANTTYGYCDVYYENDFTININVNFDAPKIGKDIILRIDDGEELYPYYKEMDHRNIEGEYIIPSGSLSKGEHLIRIIISDIFGNEYKEEKKLNILNKESPDWAEKTCKTFKDIEIGDSIYIGDKKYKLINIYTKPKMVLFEYKKTKTDGTEVRQEAISYDSGIMTDSGYSVDQVDMMKKKIDLNYYERFCRE